jgi:hypothetical protein
VPSPVFVSLLPGVHGAPATTPVGGFVGRPSALFAAGAAPSGVVPCGVVAVVVVERRPSASWSDDPFCALPIPLPAVPTLDPAPEFPEVAAVEGVHGLLVSAAEFDEAADVSFALTPGSLDVFLFGVRVATRMATSATAMTTAPATTAACLFMMCSVSDEMVMRWGDVAIVTIRRCLEKIARNVPAL